MSGIADILLNLGFKVTGSDMNKSNVTERLEKQGIKVTIGHFAENVHGADIVVYTAAIKSDNPEIVEAKRLGLELIERSDFLGAITKSYDNTIAISGTHGKTTTTSMISSIFIEAKKDPTIQVGADLKLLNNQNYRIGKSDVFVVEACEYVRSFLKFYPKCAIVLNIEEDHLDYYKDINDIKSAFNDFLNIPDETGLLIINNDDKNCIDVSKNHKAKLLTFGIKSQDSTWTAKDITILDNGCYEFTAINTTPFYNMNEKNYMKANDIKVKLSVPGYHNIYNALAAIAVSKAYGISNEDIINGLNSFTGANRRFELVGEYNSTKIYDDYAHHPTEIKATINAAKNISKEDNIWVVFQPHTYTRTYTLFNEFVDVFKNVKNVIITDIYAAREKDTGLVSSKELASKINEYSNSCIYIPTLEEVSNYLKEHVKPEDIILTIGAGTVTKVGRMILN